MQNRGDSSVNVYLNGLGLGSIAAAMYLIRKADFNPANIHIFEQMGDKHLVGGSCDASEMMVGDQPAYFMQGSRMFEDRVYACTKELWSIIPYNDHESCLEDHRKNLEECRVHTVVRLLHEHGEKDSGYQLGLNTAEKLKMARLLATPEFLIPDGAKITDIFGDTFFTSNYWYMWRALFAFQPWHSAVEMKRYMRLFFHEMPNMNTMIALERTRHTNFHSFILPALRFMQKTGVNIHYNCRMSDIDFKVDASGKKRWIERIHLETGSGNPEPCIPVGDTDLVFLTIGSIVSNASFGAHDRPVDTPAVDDRNLGGAWTLWKKIAARQPDLGRPDQFLRDISQSTMMTFTVTFRGGLFQRKFEWLVERQMGRQSPLPITASPWILHLHTYRQPLFPGQPRDTCVIWVTALGYDHIGTFVKKTMAECTGREMLEELLAHLQFDRDEEEKNEILDTSTCIPCMLPYGTSQFLGRARGDRPEVVPEGSGNFALLGQFVEIPDGIVFTTEYSVLGAMHAVKKFVKPSLVVPPMYFGQHNPLTSIAVARALAR
ncbi:oleate hydratase [Methyloversatilis sp. XJ19-49]|nr:oleate hydratase [Methyloversatilis sp. XJ19-49]